MAGPLHPHPRAKQTECPGLLQGRGPGTGEESVVEKALAVQAYAPGLLPGVSILGNVERPAPRRFRETLPTWPPSFYALQLPLHVPQALSDLLSLAPLYESAHLPS